MYWLLFDKFIGFSMGLSGSFRLDAYFGWEERVRRFYFHCVTIMRVITYQGNSILSIRINLFLRRVNEFVRIFFKNEKK